jgi:hypothetical protein
MPGGGGLDLGIFANRESAVARAEYLHRVNKAWALYGAGQVETSAAGGLDWSAVAGVRGRW